MMVLGLVGKVDFTVRHLSSATTAFPSTWGFSSSQQCIGGSGAHQCSAYIASASSETTWTMRSTFPEYVVALATIVGSVLFAIFGGVGIACLPLGLIFSFIRRPKAVITRSQYIKEATELGKKARELKKAADALHQEERGGNKGRKWRKNVKAVEKLTAFKNITPDSDAAMKLIKSVIQFCATAFAYYAQATAAQEIFGHTLQSLRGIKYLYKYNVFQIAFITLAGLTFVYYAAFGWRRKKPSGRFQLST
ncbi:unnamed protein product [Ilex paraguariensis]|uniref:LIMR family protein n=1 Tax=Ilex paraguariensis TaxID=185542 RepID=A0ABC8QMY5_9AQUA